MNAVLRSFKEQCRNWYRFRDGYCFNARQKVYGLLIERHGIKAVLRHKGALKNILDKAEEEVRREAVNRHVNC